MESTLRRTWAEIDLDAILHNYKTLRARVGEDTKYLGVVKADSYGHGSIPVSKMLQANGCDYLAVSSIDEAIELRTHDITMPILILGHTPKEQVANLIRYNITQAISGTKQADEFNEEALACGGVLTCHVKLDTGMSRIGMVCDGEHFEEAVEGIVHDFALPGLDIEGVFTHLAVSDEPGEECRAYTLHQIELFKHVIAESERRSGKKFRIRHCSNTGGVARYPESYMDMVRPGLLLYGYGDFAEELGLKPGMILKSTISVIKEYDAGTRISYGGTFETTRKTRMGVIPIGYADGLFRALSNKLEVMTDYGKAPQRGRICMDMCMIDLTDLPEVQVGDEVEIFGKRNSINETAVLAGTIPYELTCAVSKRVPRVYIRNGESVGKELMLRD